MSMFFMMFFGVNVITAATDGADNSKKMPQFEYDSSCVFLAMDKSWMQNCEGFSISMSQAKKYEHNPVLRFEDEQNPPAYRLGHLHVTQENGIYRAWYDTYYNNRFNIRYAESVDGINWTRPKLGKNANNIMAGLTDPKIYNNRNSDNPAKKYIVPLHTSMSPEYRKPENARMSYTSNHPSIKCFAYSINGVDWKIDDDASKLFPLGMKFEAPVLYKMHDTWFLIGQCLQGEYPSVQKNSRYLVVFSSKDMKNWVMSDCPGFSFPQKYNGMLQTHITPGIITYPNISIGIEGMFQDSPELMDQETDLIVLITNDGYRWRLPKAQGYPYAILRRGDLGSWDQSFLLQSAPINVGDTTRIYYGGMAHGNASYIGGRIGFAYIGLDRYGYMGLKTGWSFMKDVEFIGKIISKPISLGDGHSLKLYVNQEVPEKIKEIPAIPSVINVALLDADGKPLSGYTSEDCDSLDVSGVGVPVTWKGNSDISSLAGKKIRVQYQMRAKSNKNPLFRSFTPKFYGFYFDNPTLWENVPTNIYGKRGLERLAFSDSAHKFLKDIEITSDVPMKVTLSQIKSDGAYLRFDGNGKAWIKYRNKITEVDVAGQKEVILGK